MKPEQIFLTFPAADASTALPPRKKPGRKKADVPAEKKVLLNRLVTLELFSTIKTLTGPNNSEAQRQCRDRKARYLSDLESENAMLKQRIKELESKTCSFCKTQEVKTEQYLSRIRDLENLVSVKSNQRNDDLDPIVSHHVLSPSTQIYQSAMDTSDSLETETITSEEWIDVQPNNAPKSSVELFGPVDTEYTRSALNSLASIKDNPNIDAMINFFVLQANTTDRRLSIKYLVGLITVRYKLLDACTLLDRHMALEIMDDFKQRNEKHSINIYQFFKPPTTKKPTITMSISFHQAMIQLSNPRIKPFRDALRGIPSLFNAANLIDEFCLLFWSCTVQDDREEKLLSLVLLARKLESMCVNEEDRTRFHLATEIGREGNRSHMDELLGVQ